MLTQKKTWIYIFCGLFVACFFGSVTFNQLKVGDFQPHLRWARELGESGYLYLAANILYQRFVLIVRDLLPFNFLARVSPVLKQIIDIKSYDIAGLIVTVFTYVATFFITMRYFQKQLQITNKWSPYLFAFLSFLVMIVAPVFLFTYPERQYVGYITGNSFHNPTILLMRPFALLFFVITTGNLFKEKNWVSILLGSLVLFLSTLAKPNFTLSFVPSIFVIIVLFRIKDFKKLNLWYLFIAVALPTMVVLLSQYVIMYTGDRGDHILFAPFEAILLYVSDIPSVFCYTLLSIPFPLITTIFYWRKIKTDLSQQLVWTNFIISILIAYLFTEQTEMRALNFWWTPEIAVFLLFMVNLVVFAKEVLGKRSRLEALSVKEIVLAAVLLLQVICGILFFVSCLLSTSLVK